jgi:HAE1 family hydrophobic/amphiphilic exporter-1
MTIPPSFRKVNPADFPVLFVSLGSATLPLSAVNEYGDITIGQSLSQIPGVAQVLIFGAQKFAIRVQADPEAAAARGLSLEDIRAAVSRANSSTPVGTLNGPKQDVALQASGQMDKAADYSRVVVAWRNGSPVKLDEVAKIYDSVENDKIATWLNTSGRLCWRSRSSRRPTRSPWLIPCWRNCRYCGRKFRPRSRSTS